MPSCHNSRVIYFTGLVQILYYSSLQNFSNLFIYKDAMELVLYIRAYIRSKRALILMLRVYFLTCL
jgi:hypothetical protein